MTMIDLTRFDHFVREGCIIRKKWIDVDKYGREHVCLLAAISVEVADSARASACPADIMPDWLAHLTPWMSDSCSESEWPGFVQRYADLAHRWHVLDKQGWRRALLRSLIAILSEAKAHAGHSAAVVDRVLSLMSRELAGSVVTAAEYNEEWAEAEAEAAAAARAAARAAEAAEAAWAAARAAAAEAAAAWAAARAAAAAARAAARAAEAAAAARAAARAAEAAAAEAEEAADRIISGILDAIETECAAAEKLSKEGGNE